MSAIVSPPCCPHITDAVTYGSNSQKPSDPLQNSTAESQQREGAAQQSEKLLWSDVRNKKMWKASMWEMKMEDWSVGKMKAFSVLLSKSGEAFEGPGCLRFFFEMSLWKAC